MKAYCATICPILTTELQIEANSSQEAMEKAKQFLEELTIKIRTHKKGARRPTDEHRYCTTELEAYTISIYEVPLHRKRGVLEEQALLREEVHHNNSNQGALDASTNQHPNLGLHQGRLGKPSRR